ncbi:MAG: ArsR family transcriptional regulator, partial [bacterium]|nr:ArsR family transcriptional regulator [bacterium]
MMGNLDKIIHERSRLLIMTYLANSIDNEVSFNELQENLDLSSGNLSVQLKKLSGADMLNISKSFKDNKPYTTISITSNGS